jgi:hypothetical protein
MSKIKTPEIDHSHEGIADDSPLLYMPHVSHSGYSPTKDGKILGRFRYYEIAIRSCIGGATIKTFAGALAYGDKC